MGHPRTIIERSLTNPTEGAELPVEEGMVIQVAAGTGEGPTKLAAFDAALHEAGVENYNLIILSSIIPPGSTIKPTDGPIALQPGEWGDRLYVVKADTRIDTQGDEAWAGIGWVQDEDGRGLFVEHEGPNEEIVYRNIDASLIALQGIRKVEFGERHMKVVGIPCIVDPVCAIAVAVYKAEGWSPSPTFRDT